LPQEDRKFAFSGSLIRSLEFKSHPKNQQKLEKLCK